MSAPEHSFESDVLVSGEAIEGFEAANDLVIREPVGISADKTVDSSSSGEGDFYGVVLYDVAAGQEAALANQNCEVEIEVSESVSAGDELLPDGSGAFESVATSGGSTGVAIAQEGSGGSGELITAKIIAQQGATA